MKEGKEEMAEMLAVWEPWWTSRRLFYNSNIQEVGANDDDEKVSKHCEVNLNLFGVGTPIVDKSNTGPQEEHKTKDCDDDEDFEDVDEEEEFKEDKIGDADDQSHTEAQLIEVFEHRMRAIPMLS